MKLGDERGIKDINGNPIKIGDTVKSWPQPNNEYVGVVTWDKKWLHVCSHRGRYSWDNIKMGRDNLYEILRGNENEKKEIKS